MRAVAFLILSGVGWAEAESDSSTLLSEGRLDDLGALIRPAAAESLYRTLRWETDFWKARERAAAEGKPIYIWAGSGGGPVGVC